jgi:hypothetical protein
MDGSKWRPETTAGLDLGDRYSYLCLIDQHSGEVVEEGRLRTSPETFKRGLIHPGQAGYWRNVATRCWWPTHAS